VGFLRLGPRPFENRAVRSADFKFSSMENGRVHLEEWQVQQRGERCKSDKPFALQWLASGIVSLCLRNTVVVYRPYGARCQGRASYPSPLFSEQGLAFVSETDAKRPYSHTPNTPLFDIERQKSFKGSAIGGKTESLNNPVQAVAWNHQDIGVILLENADFVLVRIQHGPGLHGETLLKQMLTFPPLRNPLPPHDPVGTLKQSIPICIDLFENFMIVGCHLDGLVTIWDVKAPMTCSEKSSCVLRYVRKFAPNIGATSVAWVDKTLFLVGYSDGSVVLSSFGASTSEITVKTPGPSFPINRILVKGIAVIVCQGNSLFWWQDYSELDAMVQCVDTSGVFAGVDWISRDLIVANSIDGRPHFWKWGDQGHPIDVTSTHVTEEYPFSRSGRHAANGLAVSPSSSVVLVSGFYPNSLFAVHNVRILKPFAILSAITSTKTNLKSVVAQLLLNYNESEELYCTDIVFSISWSEDLLQQFRRMLDQQFDSTSKTRANDILGCIGTALINSSSGKISECLLEREEVAKMIIWKQCRQLHWVVSFLKLCLSDSLEIEKQAILSWCDIGAQLVHRFHLGEDEERDTIQEAFIKFGTADDVSNFENRNLQTKSRGAEFPAVEYTCGNTLGFQIGELWMRDMFTLKVLKSMSTGVMICVQCGLQTLLSEKSISFPFPYSAVKCFICACRLQPMGSFLIHNLATREQASPVFINETD